MASNASLRGASGAALMDGVVKLHIETFDELCRKGFDRRLRRFRVRVADRAYHLVLIRKLVQVTADAGFVPSQFTFHAACLALMTCVAGKLCMFGNLMRKGFKRFARDTLRNRIRRFRRGERHLQLGCLLNAACPKNEKNTDEEYGFQ